MSYRTSLVLAVVFAAFCCSREAAQAGTGDKPSDRIVVMISVDGLAGFYFDDPKAEMPTIRALASLGARAKSMQASTPTVTWPNHTTLVTGVTPARHGVVGNNYFDRATGSNVVLIADPVYDKDQIVRVPTLYDLAKLRGLTTAAIRWPATRNASNLDWTMPDMKPTETIKKYSTPSLLAECEQAGMPMPEKFETVHSGDKYAVQVFNHILRTHRPNLALLHIIDVDHTQHEKGPRSPEAYEAIKAADQQVAAVWEEVRRDFPGKATLFVVSDHGFSPVKRTIMPHVILRKAGLPVEDQAGAKAAVGITPQGGALMVYVRDESREAEILERVRKAFNAVPGVSKVIGSKQFQEYGVADPKYDPHAPDLIVFAEEGCTFGKTTAGDVMFKDKTEVSGSHGHDPHLAHLQATFVAWGAGIKRGAKLDKISNTSVAPTIANLLGFTIPRAEGRVLSGLLSE